VFATFNRVFQLLLAERSVSAHNSTLSKSIIIKCDCPGVKQTHGSHCQVQTAARGEGETQKSGASINELSGAPVAPIQPSARPRRSALRYLARRDQFRRLDFPKRNSNTIQNASQALLCADTHRAKLLELSARPLHVAMRVEDASRVVICVVGGAC
jgi:hypothetical protein